MQVTDHASPTAPADRDKVVFHAEGLDKVYTMGEVEVHAQRSIDLDLYRCEWCGSPNAWTIFPRSARAASSSASRSRAPSPSVRRCCSAMSPPARST